MDNRLIEEVRKKREFSRLPDSVVLRALEKSSGDVKLAREWLRKYFGVFLTNRVLRGRDLLGSHFSSRKRNYEEFYGGIFEAINNVKVEGCNSVPSKTKGSSTLASLLVSDGSLESKKFSILDLGCGVNGFSFEELVNVLGSVRYIGVEAAGQLVDFMNEFFEEKKFDGKAVKGDLMDLDFVKEVLDEEKFDVCFLFQVVDALESVEKDYSKRLVSLIMESVGLLVISLPVVSLGGRKRIGEEKRMWLVDWLGAEFEIIKDFEMFGERVLVIGR
jgi:hypothetical protein